MGKAQGDRISIRYYLFLSIKTPKFMELGVKQEAWIAALRSGKYKQATNRLFTEEGYCCLGVMCVLEGKEFVKGVKEECQNPNDYYIKGTSFDRVSPDEIAIEMYGLRSNIGSSADINGYALTTLNDNGSTFEEIADLLEKNPDEYFTKTA